MPYRERLNHYKRHFARADGITLFGRDAGVICVEAPNVIPKGRTLDDVWGFVERLQACELDWLWESDAADVPTLLTAATAPELVAELRAREHARYWPRTTLVGADRGCAGEIATADVLPSALRRFAATEQGPVRIVVFQIGGTPEQRIFLPHRRVRAVDDLLAQLGIDPDDAAHRRDYVPQSGITLEALYRAS